MSVIASDFCSAAHWAFGLWFYSCAGCGQGGGGWGQGRYQAAELRPNTERPTLTFRKSVNFQSIQLGRLEAHLKGDFPGSPAVRTLLPLQGAQVQFLVRKLKIPHTVQHTAQPSGPAKKLI